MSGEDRDRFLLSASAILMPGLVGLVAVDSFHYAIPILFTTLDNHSPEVIYLEDGVNSLMLDSRGDADSYTAMVRRFLESEELAEQLREGCRQAANRYTIEDTAANFVKGVHSI